MVKKILIGLGFIFLLLLILDFKYPYYEHYLIGEKVMVNSAKKEAYLALQKFTQEERLNIQDFKLKEIERGCCAEGYFYHVLYCHSQWAFKYDSYLSRAQAWLPTKDHACQIYSTSQYSPYLGH